MQSLHPRVGQVKTANHVPSITIKQHLPDSICQPENNQWRVKVFRLIEGAGEIQTDKRVVQLAVPGFKGYKLTVSPGKNNVCFPALNQYIPLLSGSKDKCCLEIGPRFIKAITSQRQNDNLGPVFLKFRSNQECTGFIEVLLKKNNWVLHPVGDMTYEVSEK